MPDQLTNLVAAQAAMSAKITAAAVQQIWALWSKLGPSDWWNDDLVHGNAAKSSTLIMSALKQTRMTQRSFSKSMFDQMQVGMSTLPPAQSGYSRANTNPFEVYQRPATEIRWLQSQGLAFDDAYMRAKTRVQKMAEADLLRARMDEAQSLNAANGKVIGTRRIIHPELSKTGTCGLCVVASTQFYKTSVLLALHGGCKCSTLPIKKDSDPGLKLNKQDLQEIYNAAGSSYAEDLRNTRVKISEHGELGPILVKQGDHFRTPEEAGRPKFVRLTPEGIRAERLKERDDVSAALANAQANYNELIKTQEPGHGEALAQWRAMKFMREYLASLDQALKN